MIRYVLTDIEGTTTPITFVHDVLFPYSAAHLRTYVEQHAGDEAVKAIMATTTVEQLLTWIKDDKKEPALKTLQGLIWQTGYETGAYTSQIYPDVKPALEAWKKRGLMLGVYSSGSVAAQKLLFKYTGEGDLTPLFSHYFDTAVGAKRETSAYAKILKALELKGSDVLFLSDISEELDAAKTAGMHGVQLVRPGTKPTDRHPTAADFAAVDAQIKAFS